MKILVTYEKHDILRLVEADMRAQGIALKANTALEYKGAMQVRFSVETDDATPVAAPATSANEDKSTSPTTPVITPEPSMDAVMAESQRLVRVKGGKMEVRSGPKRVLGPNESLDPPTGE